MEGHGTAPYTLGQYNEILGSLQRALPKVLRDTDPKKTIGVFQKGTAVENTIREVVLKLLSEEAKLDYYLVSVDYDMSIEEATKQAGMNVDNQISRRDEPFSLNEIFSIQKDGKAKIVLEIFNPNDSWSVDAVLEELDRYNRRAADLQEVIALVNCYPEMYKHQEVTSIVALGSVYEHSTRGQWIPVVYLRSSGFYLGFCPRDMVLNDLHHIPVIRK